MKSKARKNGTSGTASNFATATTISVPYSTEFQPEEVDQNFSQSMAPRSSKSMKIMSRTTNSSRRRSPQNFNSIDESDEADNIDETVEGNFEMFVLPVPMGCDASEMENEDIVIVKGKLFHERIKLQAQNYSS